MKTCNKCNIQKDSSDFSPRKESADKLSYICRPCDSERVKSARELKYGVRVRAPKKSDEELRQGRLERAKSYREKNKEAHRSYNQKRCALYRERNPEKVKLAKTVENEKRKALRALRPPKIEKPKIRSLESSYNRFKQREWYLRNKEKAAQKAIQRHRARKQAIPIWLTDEHKRRIKEFYDAATDCQWLSSEPLQVDHIVPLKGKTVCGLHVPWNLQVLPRTENIKKSNKLN